MSTLESVLERAHPAGQTTVLTISLAGLAVINDGFGREIGDRVLRSVAERLQRVASGDKARVARFGSDKFAILLENSPTTPSAAALAAHVSSELAEPMDIDGRRLVVSACVGVVEHQGCGGQATQLVRTYLIFMGARGCDLRVRCRSGRCW